MSSLEALVKVQKSSDNWGNFTHTSFAYFNRNKFAKNRITGNNKHKGLL